MNPNPNASGTNTSTPIRFEAPQGHPSFMGRLILGLLLTQGLYYGLRQLAMAWMIHSETRPDFFQTEEGSLVLVAGQLFALLVGGIVGGSGLPLGVAYGLTLGLLNAAALFGAERALNVPPNRTIVAVGTPLHLLIGSVGGLLGRVIWRPLPPLPRYDTPGSSSAIKQTEEPNDLDRGPLIWSRILTGVVFAFVGTVFAHDLRAAMGRYARTSSIFFDQFVNWQIGAVIVLLGGAFAGVLTRRGLMSGCIVGVLAAMGLIVAQYAKPIIQFPSHEFWMSQLDLKKGTQVELPVVIFTLGHTLILALFGGWLGAQLAPPTGRRAGGSITRI